MTPIRRTAPLVCVVLLAGLALSGCGAKDAETEMTSTKSSTTSATTSATSAPAAASSANTAKPAGDKVASADLPAVVADRTYRGVEEGKPYAEYYAPDGSLRGKADGAAYTGSWKVVGEQLCFTYPKEGSDSEVDCYAVFKNGDAVSWVDSDGKIVEATFVEGNPDKL